MDSLVAWCKEEIEKMNEIVALMKEGKLKTISYTTGKPIDETDAWSSEYERRTKELEAIITRAAAKNSN